MPAGRRSANLVPTTSCCAKLAVVFERFTDRSRHVLVLAQQEAFALGHDFIGTEHILLGLVAEHDGVAATALDSLGVRLEPLRAKVAEVVGSSAAASGGSPPFTPRAKRVLELSLREALGLGHNYIGTEHLLLAIAREGSGAAVRVLGELGVPLERIRPAVLSLLDSPEVSAASPLPSVSRRAVSRGVGGARWLSRRTPGPPRERPGRPGAYLRGRVELDYDGRRMKGTVASQPVDLSVSLPASSGEASGSFAGVAVSGSWRLGPNLEWAPEVPGRLAGSFGGEQFALRGWFDLDAGAVFDYAQVEGYWGEEPVSVFARAAVPGVSDGSLLVDGSLGGAGFSMRSHRDPRGGSLRGAVDGEVFDLRVERGGDGGELSISGDFHGPAPLLAVIVACLAYFA